MAARKTTAPEPEIVTPAPAEITTPDEGESPSPDEADAQRADGADEPSTVDLTPVTVVMQIAITGTRDGEPWPRVGATITLPADEADRYMRLGYAVRADD